MIKYPQSSTFSEESFLWLTVHGTVPHHYEDHMQQVIAYVIRKHLEDWKLSLADCLRGGPWQVPGAEHISLWETSHI